MLLYRLVCMILVLHLVVLVELRLVTDGQTDTGPQHIPRRAAKTGIINKLCVNKILKCTLVCIDSKPSTRCNRR